jgi:hypothetical protein
MDNQNKEQIKEQENEVDPFVEVEFKEVANTSHSPHFYVEDPQQDPNSELLQVMCTGCNSGCNIDPKEFSIKEGKIVKNS